MKGIPTLDSDRVGGASRREMTPKEYRVVKPNTSSTSCQAMLKFKVGSGKIILLPQAPEVTPNSTTTSAAYAVFSQK